MNQKCWVKAKQSLLKDLSSIKATPSKNAIIDIINGPIYFFLSLWLCWYTYFFFLLFIIISIICHIIYNITYFILLLSFIIITVVYYSSSSCYYYYRHFYEFPVCMRFIYIFSFDFPLGTNIIIQNMITMVV